MVVGSRCIRSVNDFSLDEYCLRKFNGKLFFLLQKIDYPALYSTGTKLQN
jgi:hypothetical protein